MKTVLIIEDDPDLRGVVAQYLEHSGWLVIEAGDGERGVSLARQHRPAAILCDLLMPRSNGFQVCSALRNDLGLKQTKIIAVSGKGYESNRLNALEAGADEFITKPFNPADLVALLARMTEGASSGARPGDMVSPTQPAMLRFWGVRGSIPAPGPSTVKYGGNTSCIEVRADGELIVLDAGTGIRQLGLSLMAEFKDKPIDLTLLITHSHWDHIQGFPFFLPAYDPNNFIRILGYEGAREGLARVLTSQMESPYFPIGLKQLPSNIAIEEQKDLEFNVGKVKVKAWFMNHPGVCVGYRLYTSGGSISYLPDNEPSYRVRDEGNKPGSASQEFVQAELQKMIDFVSGSDVLILDSQYDTEEYKSHIGWGHGCVDDVVDFAIKARVKQLYLFHHDPAHDDEKVTSMLTHARALVAAQRGAVQVDAAREGLKFELAASGKRA